MKDKVGETFEGRVVSVNSFGLKVRLRDVYVEGFLHVSYMTDDYYEYHDKSMSLVGLNRKKRYSVGKELTVRIESVNLEDREIIFGIASSPGPVNPLPRDQYESTYKRNRK